MVSYQKFKRTGITVFDWLNLHLSHDGMLTMNAGVILDIAHCLNFFFQTVFPLIDVREERFLSSWAQ
jgi:hypothetical protein